MLLLSYCLIFLSISIFLLFSFFFLSSTLPLLYLYPPLEKFQHSQSSGLLYSSSSPPPCHFSISLSYCRSSSILSLLDKFLSSILKHSTGSPLHLIFITDTESKDKVRKLYCNIFFAFISNLRFNLSFEKIKKKNLDWGTRQRVNGCMLLYHAVI